MQTPIRIGTRESELALWQANLVNQRLQSTGVEASLVLIKTEGDLDLKTPLYEMGVQGIFTRSLDIALLNNRIDLAVHSMKDVPVQLPEGIVQAAVLERGSPFDLLVCRHSTAFLQENKYPASIATSSIRRKAQWLHRYSHHRLYNLRGNVNTRLEKLSNSTWDAAIFAKAGLERINKIPEASQVIEWMLPAPAQGAIMVVCRSDDAFAMEVCKLLDDSATSLCTRTERDFLRTLLGGCSTPISAYANLENGYLRFRGNMLSPDGKQIAEIEKTADHDNCKELGTKAALELLSKGGEKILKIIQHA